jgi:hypothetical protein
LFTTYVITFSTFSVTNFVERLRCQKLTCNSQECVNKSNSLSTNRIVDYSAFVSYGKLNNADIKRHNVTQSACTTFLLPNYTTTMLVVTVVAVAATKTRVWETDRND